MNRTPAIDPSPSASGFSLIEVLVALVVLSIGLLGIAKMQALGLSSTSVAGKRALAAVAADSLAGAMHVNQAFWSTAAGQGTWTASTAPVPSCLYSVTGTAPSCTPAALAAFDLQQWAQSLAGLLPSPVGTVTCNALTPQTCTINVTWAEKTLAINTQGIPGAQTQVVNGTNYPSYTLYVEP